MCGIFGTWHIDGKQVDLIKTRRVTTLLQHRGPDDEGYLFINTKSGRWEARRGKDTMLGLQMPHVEEGLKYSYNMALGFRRLSIIDLSFGGHQPMSSEDGSLWIVFNGEIYNYLEIRKELELVGYCFKTQTDTEVILYAYEEWGTDCLNRFNGMWAFCIWDSKKKRIFCARDRAGIKPFYYTFSAQKFVFASEIKALLALDETPPEPNDQIVADYLFSGFLDHTEETFFKNIYQLRPGEYLLIEGERLNLRPYWDIEPKEVRLAKESDYGERFYELLEDSIRLRLRSDVPVGSCLSGGLDSSSIVCIANKLMFDGRNIDPRLVGEKQKTFSSCFENHVYDERKFIELVIYQTGAEKNYVFPRPEDLLNDVEKLIWHHDEPFGSTSIYAQWNVMKLAKERGVTVLLDGQGADELLGGYLPSFYYLFGQLLKNNHLRCLMEEINQFRKKHWIPVKPLLMGILTVLLPNWLKSPLKRKVMGGLEWASADFRKRYFRTFPIPGKFENDLDNHLYHIFRSMTLPALLHYEDRNSMAFSLETRLPFLDYRLVEFIFSVPTNEKIRGGMTKVILRNALRGFLPEAIRNRVDKMGFVTPEDIWFRTILRDHVDEIIRSKSFAQKKYFNINKVKRAFDQHCWGKTNISFTIWRWVNLELWFRAFIDRKPSATC
jgi:asparagine synthase (glutamine-hydrolysing)